MQLIPASVTFGNFPDDVPDATITIGRNGAVKERKPFYQTTDVQVLLIQPEDGIHITNSQRRMMVQIILAGQFTNPCLDIKLIGGASPWCWMELHDAYPQMTLKEALKMRPVDYRRVLLRKRPSIKERCRE